MLHSSGGLTCDHLIIRSILPAFRPGRGGGLFQVRGTDERVGLTVSEPLALYLTEADCRALLTPADVLGAIEEAFRWDADGAVGWPEPRHLRMSDRLGNHYHLKACILESASVAGVRLVGHQADEAGGTSTRWIVLLDACTALPLAIIDESWNYAQRTVAVMALAARKLAGPKARSLAVVGAGRLAAAALTYYAHLFDLEQVHIASRRPETRAELARKARETHNLPASPATSVAEAVAGADLVLTCTSAGRQLLEEPWVAPGAVVACLDTAEPGLDLVRGADLVVVDSREQLRDELTDLYGSEAPGWVDATISEVMSGRHPGRSAVQDRVLVISQGLASLDIALAYRAYRLARTGGCGSPLPFPWSQEPANPVSDHTPRGGATGKSETEAQHVPDREHLD